MRGKNWGKCLKKEQGIPWKMPKKAEESLKINSKSIVKKVKKRKRAANGGRENQDFFA